MGRNWRDGPTMKNQLARKSYNLPESYELSQEEGLSLRGCGDWVDGEVPVSDLAQVLTLHTFQAPLSLLEMWLVLCLPLRSCTIPRVPWTSQFGSTLAGLVAFLFGWIFGSGRQ